MQRAHELGALVGCAHFAHRRSRVKRGRAAFLIKGRGRLGHCLRRHGDWGEGCGAAMRWAPRKSAPNMALAHSQRAPVALIFIANASMPASASTRPIGPEAKV